MIYWDLLERINAPQLKLQFCSRFLKHAVHSLNSRPPYILGHRGSVLAMLCLPTQTSKRLPPVVAFHVHVVLHNDTKGTIEIPVWDQPEQLADIRTWERSGTPILFLWCKCWTSKWADHLLLVAENRPLGLGECFATSPLLLLHFFQRSHDASVISPCHPGALSLEDSLLESCCGCGCKAFYAPSFPMTIFKAINPLMCASRLSSHTNFSSAFRSSSPLSWDLNWKRQLVLNSWWKSNVVSNQKCACRLDILRSIGEDQQSRSVILRHEIFGDLAWT